MAKHKRQQSAEAESQVNTRQDRNTFLSDGGTWTWDSGTGALTWSGTARLQRAGVVTHTVAAGSVSGIISVGQTAYAVVSRTGGGATSIVSGGSNIEDVANSTDFRLVLGARGADGRFYFRNGTVMSDGDSKQFGQLNSATDRTDVVADGNALQAVGFTFVAAANQLAVYVGGILQTLGVDYVETGTTQITFQDGSTPAEGELISFVNIVGGEGPAATGTVSLQDAWAVGPLIDVTAGTGVAFKGSGGQFVVKTVFDPGSGDYATWGVQAGSGSSFVFSGSGGYTFAPNSLSGAMWTLVPIDDGGSDAMLVLGNAGVSKGVRIASSGLLEFGEYTGPSYPGGVWAGDGGIRWSVYTGTLNSGAPTVIATGLTDILGVVFSVLNGATGTYICWESENASNANRSFAVAFDPGTGIIRVAGNPLGIVSPGSHVDGEAYRMVVLHQGV